MLYEGIYLVNIGNLLQRNILNALKRLIQELLSYSNKEKDQFVKQVIDRLERNYSMLDRVKPPIIPTRRFIYAIENLLSKLFKLNSVAKEYMDKRISLEEFRRIVSEYEDALRLYANIASSERIKMSIYMVLPQITLLATIAYQVFLLGLPLSLHILSLAFTLLAASLFVLLINPILSYIINVANVFLVLNTILSSMSISKALSHIMLIILYMLTLITSITYIHVLYITSSRKSVSMVEKTLLTLLRDIGLKTSESKTSGEKNKEEEYKKLYNELKGIYKDMYGEFGEEYFRFRYMILLVNGMPPNEILKKFLSEIRNIRIRKDN